MSMSTSGPSPQSDQNKSGGEIEAAGFRTSSSLRLALAILIVLLITAYTAGVISGRIKDQNKINAVDLAVIGFGAVSVLLLVYPDLLKGLTHLELGSLKVDIEQVKASQLRQE